jgi:hypothetical protein
VTLTTLAHAQPDGSSLKLPTAIYLGAASADVATTICCQHAGCKEDNPLVSWLKPQGTAVMLVVGEAADLTGLWARNRFVGRKHPRLAKVGLYVVAGVRVAVAARNFREGRAQRRSNALRAEPVLQ